MAIRKSRTGIAFAALRICQLICLFSIIGLTGKLAVNINRIDGPGQPAAVEWAISVCTLFVTWVLVTLILHLIGSVIRYIITTVMDAIFFPLLIVVAVLLGKPIYDIDCDIVGALNSEIETLNEIYRSDGFLYAFSVRPFPAYNDTITPGPSIVGLKGLNSDTATLKDAYEAMGDYRQWVGRCEGYCVRMKVAWGLSIAMAVSAAVTVLLAWKLWRKSRKVPELREGWDYDGGYTTGVDGLAAAGVQYPTQIPDPEGMERVSRETAVTEDELIDREKSSRGSGVPPEMGARILDPEEFEREMENPGQGSMRRERERRTEE